ncbi:MAG TPA: agmatinase family protein [Bdellovibrionales bacterium]|jgi:agmatinase|nr:agmatinase family protein [Bdellovibrionales bacterium]
MSFDPNSTASAESGIFGLPFGADESRLHLLQVPWEVTTSYGDGASRGPAAILRASHQVDLFDIETGDAYNAGYFLHDESPEIASMGRELKKKAKTFVEAIENGSEQESGPQKIQAEINAASAKVNEWVYSEAKKLLDGDRIVGLLGGDHSTPFGLIKAVTEKYKGDVGILHVDAHADLRNQYQGYHHSHASIMHNVMEKIKPAKLVQVGIRDFSPGEFEYIQKNPNRIHTYFDPLNKRRLNKGESWQKLCDEMVSHLPKNVYISFDIDGLTPDLCPNTGTPVPGGLTFDQALTLFATVAESGRRIVGFDLNEVAEPEEPESDWDGNVGARILFKLCGWTMVTNGFATARKNS